MCKLFLWFLWPCFIACDSYFNVFLGQIIGCMGRNIIYALFYGAGRIICEFMRKYNFWLVVGGVVGGE